MKLAIHTGSGNTITAPFEAWVVALVNSLPEVNRQMLYKMVSRMEGASLMPDKFQIKEDELGTITMVQNPTLSLGL